MKRSCSTAVFQCTRSKRPRLVSPLCTQRIKTWVAATHIHNYMIKDPLCDWLSLSHRDRSSPAPVNQSSFKDYLMNRGNAFEESLVKYIADNVIEIKVGSKMMNAEGCARTVELMKQGCPVIHSAPVRTADNTGGIIDLLVRSDVINSLVEYPALKEEKIELAAPKLGFGVHYLVVDVKYTSLPLRADGHHLLNSGSFKAYKAQTWIYNQAIGEIQGFTPQYAFILGRRWKYKSKDVDYSSDSCLGKLGVIDYAGVDKDFPDQTAKAVRWVRDLQKNGKNWSVDPPTREELYPNMCVDSGAWNSEKERIAQNLGEITMLWHCGIRERENAFSNGIKSWRTNGCSSTALGVWGQRAPIIDAIISVNQAGSPPILPRRMESNIFGWKESEAEVYVDFETLLDVFADFSELPRQRKTEMIFMIGVGQRHRGRWKYTKFVAESPTPEEEYRIMDDFARYISELGNPRIVYWCAEKRFWSSAESRQFDRANALGDTDTKDYISDEWQDFEWLDLCDVFKSEPIVIKGCHKFGLKDIAKAMRQHGMIRSSLDTECKSGMMAAVRAWESYQSPDAVNSEVMKDIGKYNEFDCKVLYEMLLFLRRKYA